MFNCWKSVTFVMNRNMCSDFLLLSLVMRTAWKAVQGVRIQIFFLDQKDGFGGAYRRFPTRMVLLKYDIYRAPIFPRFRRFPRKWSFRIHKKKTNPRKKIRPNLFLKRQLKLTQTASKLQPWADDRILHLVFALQYEISRDQPVAIVFWVKMPRFDFVRRHEAAFRDFHIFFVGALYIVEITPVWLGTLDINSESLLSLVWWYSSVMSPCERTPSAR